MKDGRLTAGDWLRTLGPGLLTGVVFVAVAMLVENKVIKISAKLIE